ncbi:MAG: Type 1 glutamine amidotransferase-like domain-containing protein [Clostridia bacterium]|nr:Type 1 glutamine amidotransferase-like domain-containing protein [Clostridia bacterium]
MFYFLTSSPFAPGTPYLNPANGFLDALSRALPKRSDALFICANPNRPAYTEHIARDMRTALEHEGYSFSDFRVLDGRNEKDAPALVADAELIVFAGGHVPTQNAFFQKINLKACMKTFDGVLIGISAGTMNCADPVYAQPEEEGEAVSPHYRRFLPGLGVTSTMLLPHYQMVKDDTVDGLKLFDEITLPDSISRTFYAIPDGSYLLGRNGRETLFGEAHRIRDGRMEQVCRENEALALS